MQARILLGLVALATWGAISAEQASPTLPLQLTITGEQWSVIQPAKVHDAETYTGWTDCKARLIEIKRSESDWSKAETVTHEVLHAITCKDGDVHNDKLNNVDEDAHQGIYFAAPKLADFIADNPQAVDYIRWARVKK